jgi:hypothetical protein
VPTHASLGELAPGRQDPLPCTAAVAENWGKGQVIKVCLQAKPRHENDEDSVALNRVETVVAARGWRCCSTKSRTRCTQHGRWELTTTHSEAFEGISSYLVNYAATTVARAGPRLLEAWLAGGGGTYRRRGCAP